MMRRSSFSSSSNSNHMRSRSSSSSSSSPSPFPSSLPSPLASPGSRSSSAGPSVNKSSKELSSPVNHEDQLISQLRLAIASEQHVVDNFKKKLRNSEKQKVWPTLYQKTIRRAEAEEIQSSRTLAQNMLEKQETMKGKELKDVSLKLRESKEFGINCDLEMLPKGSHISMDKTINGDDINSYTQLKSGFCCAQGKVKDHDNEMNKCYDATSNTNNDMLSNATSSCQTEDKVSLQSNSIQERETSSTEKISYGSYFDHLFSQSPYAFLKSSIR